MVSGKVIRINDWPLLQKTYDRKVAFPLYCLAFILFFLIISLNSRFSGNLIPVGIFIFLLLMIFTPIILSMVIFRWYFQFTRFGCNDHEMVLISPRRGFNKNTIVYSIPYSSIQKVYLNSFGSYIISMQLGLLNFLGKPINKISALHFTIPLSIVKVKKNETKIFQAFDYLNRHYLDQPGVFIFYDPQKVYYSPMKDVRKLRGGSGKVIFSVDQSPGKDPLYPDSWDQ